MPTEWLKTIAHGGKSSRAIGCVRYCPLDPRLKTRVCARTMYQKEIRSVIESINNKYGSVENMDELRNQDIKRFDN